MILCDPLRREAAAHRTRNVFVIDIAMSAPLAGAFFVTRKREEGDVQ